MSQRARILIVDDEPMNLDLLEQELELLDHVAVTAADGYQALERIDETIDVVLLDVMMPGLDGFEVLRRIRADPARRTLPVIMVSALSELDAVIRGIELGADDYLPKPFEPTLLKARLEAYASSGNAGPTRSGRISPRSSASGGGATSCCTSSCRALRCASSRRRGG